MTDESSEGLVDEVVGEAVLLVLTPGAGAPLDLAIRVEKLETVKMMKSIVPEFISRNSEYEKLDKL